MYRLFKYVNSCNSFIAINHSALGANKYLITHNATSCKLPGVASIAYFRIVLTHAIAGEVQGCIVWEVNL
jgi:hypothetical protein